MFNVAVIAKGLVAYYVAMPDWGALAPPGGGGFDAPLPQKARA